MTLLPDVCSGLVVGPALTEVSWRLAFLVNVPIGILVIYLAITTLRETPDQDPEFSSPRRTRSR